MTGAERYATLRALYGSTSYTAAERQLIQTLYKELLNKAIPNCHCSNRYRDAVIELCVFLKNSAEMKEREFILKRGVVIHFNGEVYSSKNLTDEVARAYLKQFPSAEKMFDKVALVAEEVAEAKTPKKKKRK